MRRQFSAELEEDREFEIGGQIFKFVYPHWKVGADLFDQEMDEVKQASNGQTEESVFSFVADTETAIKRVPMFLDPGNDAHKRWKDLVARKTDPVPRHQIAQVYRWLVEVTAGLPTNPPSGLEPGGGNSDNSSGEGSSSVVETPTP